LIIEHDTIQVLEDYTLSFKQSLNLLEMFSHSVNYEPKMNNVDREIIQRRMKKTIEVLRSLEDENDSIAYFVRSAL
jgi:hypothetical protein